MFYFQANVTIQSPLPLTELASCIARALSLPSFKLDTSGRYDGDVVYGVTCFGLDFELAENEHPLTSFHLTVNSNVDQFDFDGSEKEVDGGEYLLSLLRRGGINAAAREPKLLYGD